MKYRATWLRGFHVDLPLDEQARRRAIAVTIEASTTPHLLSASSNAPPA